MHPQTHSRTAPDWQHPPAGKHAKRTSLGTSKIPNWVVGRKETGSCKAALSEITSFSQPIFCLHCTIFHGVCVWKKPPAHVRVHTTIKKAKLGPNSSISKLHELRFSELLGMNIYNTYICTQTFIWFACLEYEIVCMCYAFLTFFFCLFSSFFGHFLFTCFL